MSGVTRHWLGKLKELVTRLAEMILRLYFFDFHEISDGIVIETK